MIMQKYTMYKAGDPCPLFQDIDGKCGAIFGRACIVHESDTNYEVSPIDELFENSIILSDIVYKPKKRLIIFNQVVMAM